jgi:hypothetical protein
MRLSAHLRSMLGLIALWAVLLIAAYLAPFALSDDDPADVVTRQTARVAVLYWGLAATAILLRRRDFGRWAWTLGCVAFLVHVVTAFDRVHRWSNSAAVGHVEDVSGFGPGLYVSYAFTALWVVDAAWWWIDRAGYESRSIWLDRALHTFMAFVVFNGTVVYESGLIRWAGGAIFLMLALLLAKRLWAENRVRPGT